MIIFIYNLLNRMFYFPMINNLTGTVHEGLFFLPWNKSNQWDTLIRI